jgi:hypothetical protein
VCCLQALSDAALLLGQAGAEKADLAEELAAARRSLASIHTTAQQLAAARGGGWEDGGGGGGPEELRIAELKAQLGRAVQEKVEALVRLAHLEVRRAVLGEGAAGCGRRTAGGVAPWGMPREGAQAARG